MDDRVDALLAGPRPVDLVAEFGLPVPSLVICELLGVPYEDHALFQSCSRRMALATAPAESAEAVGELRDHLARLLARKAADPGDDLISRLVAEQVATGALGAEEAVDLCLVLLGRVSKVPPGPRRLARTLAALSERPSTSSTRAILRLATARTRRRRPRPPGGRRYFRNTP
ncbi:hypothetical protein [Streptomyces sp. NPDC026666]|uniref:hypothetical protein n=1 Tax=Streptomyces sp. NPDC026666 TaxID=3154799 RepID=UPI0034550427